MDASDPANDSDLTPTSKEIPALSEPEFHDTNTCEETTEPRPLLEDSLSAVLAPTEVFRSNGRYNLMKDLLYLSRNEDNSVLIQVKSRNGFASCEYCLAYADRVRSSSERLKEHILSNHVMVDIFCEYENCVEKPVFQSLRTYQAHVKKFHFSAYNVILSGAGNGFHCIFCKDRSFIRGTQMEYLKHLAYNHSRNLMELKMIRWPESWDRKTVEALADTWTEVIDPKEAFLREVIPSPAGVMPPIINDESDESGRGSRYDSSDCCQLLKSLIYLDSHRDDVSLWDIFMKLYRVRYYCTFCRAFATGAQASYLMHLHEESHRDSDTRVYSPYSCFCGSNYRDVSTLKGHILEIHTKTILNCDQCGKKYLTLGSLSRHYREEHPKSPQLKSVKKHGSLTCPFCPNYTNATPLKMLSHCIRSHFRFVIELSYLKKQGEQSPTLDTEGVDLRIQCRGNGRNNEESNSKCSCLSESKLNDDLHLSLIPCDSNSYNYIICQFNRFKYTSDENDIAERNDDINSGQSPTLEMCQACSSMGLGKVYCCGEYYYFDSELSKYIRDEKPFEGTEEENVVQRLPITPVTGYSDNYQTKARRQAHNKGKIFKRYLRYGLRSLFIGLVIVILITITIVVLMSKPQQEVIEASMAQKPYISHR
uniref:C2H2-type domain-containing protein n=1 Tax=Syphacia muris TaxID=451379 RepID=A0A0N5AI93_9BILA